MNNKIRTVVAAGAALASTVGLVGMATGAEAAPRSVCGYSSAPDGIVVVGDPSTYNNAGEVVSYVAPPIGAPGEQVRATCNPTLQP